MSSTPATISQDSDPGAAYQAAYDALGKAYWEASDIDSKDLVYGAQQAIGDILTAIDEQQLATNTALFVQLTPKIKAINQTLQNIEKQITQITKNLDTASTVISTINKVLSVWPSL
jgi:hypothetical protein